MTTNLLRRSRLENLCVLVTDGTHDSPKLQTEGVPFIKGKHISSGIVDFADCDFITTEDHEEACRRVKPQRGDILFSNIGSVGDTAVVRSNRKFSIKNVALFRADIRKIDPVYLYYLVLSPEFRANVLNMRSGSAQPFISLGNLRSFEVNYHVDIVAQRQVASILSAYDDLIDNNLRRIKILEEMARAIYRQWFAEFRAPGVKLRSASPAEKRATGKDVFPEGWDVRPIGQVVETLGGGTPSTKQDEYWNDGEVTWFTPSDLTAASAMFIAGSAKRIARLGLQKSAARLFPPYSVMMTSRATIGVTAINTGEACTNQGFITCVPNEHLSAIQMYFWIEQHKEKIISIASGATYKEISRSEFRELLIPVAVKESQARFVDNVSPLAGHIENLLSKNQNLRHTRDFLLPRLMSGAVSVADLGIATVNDPVREAAEVTK
jgi:type I restriction enzyme S subunit